MEYSEIYSRFLSRAKPQNLLSLSDDDFNNVVVDYLHSSISNPQVRKLFDNISLDDEIQKIEYVLVEPIDEKSDREFVIDVLSQSMVIQWMRNKLDTDLSLAIMVGGKEEKMLKNDLKINYSRLDSLRYELQRTIRNHGYYNGSYSTGNS